MADSMFAKLHSPIPGQCPMMSAADVAAALPWKILVPHLSQQLSLGGDAPLRHHHSVQGPGNVVNTLLLMPAWRGEGLLGIKLVMVAPSNGAIGLPAITSLYVLMDAMTGAMVALIDGGELTARRTAAVSAVALSHLARKDAHRHLIVGTGRLCRNVALSHASVRNISQTVVWGRSIDAAEAAADDIAALCGARPEVANDLEAEVRRADIVTCVTLSKEPLVRGEWLRPGTHLDLIGGFTPDMREADDVAIRRGRVFVDALSGAPVEAGDIVQPLRSGVLKRNEIVADLFDLCSGVAGRRTDQEITIFKSAGHALQDLAAAELVAQTLAEATSQSSTALSA